MAREGNVSPAPRQQPNGRSLIQLRRRITEVLRLWDRDPAHIDVVEVLDLPASLEQAIAATTKQRRELEEQSRAVQRDMEQTMRRLQLS
jgi:hypothetical protein